PEEPIHSARALLGCAFVAGCVCYRFCLFRQSNLWALSGWARRVTRSGAGFALRIERMSPLIRFWLALSVALCPILGSASAHSRIDCSALNSSILKRAVRYCVFIPSGYDDGATQKPPRRYPVLYFLHGL